MFFDVWCSLTSGLFWSQNACDWVFCCSSMLNNVKNGFVFLKKKAFLVVKLKARDVFNECQMLRCFAWICMFHLKKKKDQSCPFVNVGKYYLDKTPGRGAPLPLYSPAFLCTPVTNHRWYRVSLLRPGLHINQQSEDMPLRHCQLKLLGPFRHTCCTRPNANLQYAVTFSNYNINTQHICIHSTSLQEDECDHEMLTLI